MLNFLKKWYLYILFSILGILLYIYIFQINMNDQINDLYIYLTTDKKGKELLTTFGLSLANLFFVAVFVKILFLQRPISEMIYEHFKSIFLNRDFFNYLNKNELIKIAQKIEEVDDSLSFSYNDLKNESIKLLEADWNNGDKKSPCIITEFHNWDTIYKKEKPKNEKNKDLEIRNKRVCFKMMRDEEEEEENEKRFKYQYGFRPFDKIIQKSDFENTFNNRWEGKDFKWRCIKTNEENTEMEIICDIQEDKKNEWIIFSFKNNRDRQELKKGDEFFIEFSISSPVDLSQTKEAKKRREEYFVSDYQIDCAYRFIGFQIETYNNILPFKPVLKVNKNVQKKKPTENIYYKSWKWDLFYATDKGNKVKITIE